MAIHRTRKDKENPHYGFLISWEPKKEPVKRESKTSSASLTHEPGAAKSANRSDKVAEARSLKKDIVRSLIMVGIVLTLELVVYLAWNKFVLP